MEGERRERVMSVGRRAEREGKYLRVSFKMSVYLTVQAML